MCVTNRTTQILYVLVDWLMFLVFPVWKLGGNCKKLRFQGQSFGVLIITHIVSQFQSQLSFFCFFCLFVCFVAFFLSFGSSKSRQTDRRKVPGSSRLGLVSSCSLSYNYFYRSFSFPNTPLCPFRSIYLSMLRLRGSGRWNGVFIEVACV